MDLVEVNVLGAFRILAAGQDLSEGAADKARALVTYLALEGEQPRTLLSALLWPDLAQEAAFTNLRKTIYRLRQRVGVDLLSAGRQSVQLDLPRVVVDVVRFQSTLKESERHPHAAIITCDECIARLGDAVDYYLGELLAGFGLGDLPAFEEWLLLCRESLREQALLTLSTLATAWELRGELARAYAYGSRALALDPLNEASQRQQMRLLAKMGMPNQALAQYESFRRTLKQELNVEVEGATTALAQQIRAKEFEEKAVVASLLPQAKNPKAALPASASAQLLKDVPLAGRLYGRQHEIERLSHWLTQTPTRLITIVGMGGIGKTTLATAVTRSVANAFDSVLWRSMINAPPLEEILLEWLATLAEDRLVPLPKSLDGQLAALLEHLRTRRCLLVLDNFESIFQANLAGQMRPEHRPYAQLLQRIAETDHQSCLLVTSRELPQGIERLEEDFTWVRSLALGALDMTAAQALLFDRGLSGQRAATISLVERYSGNPLALKLVAETAQGLFNGDIAAFLLADTLIFDDIRAVLDWQFERLPMLEQELLIWLAIEREPVSIQTLCDNTSPPRPLLEVLVAVRGLQRRSLLERFGSSDPGTLQQPETPQMASTFALQNVLMEYLIDRLVEAAYQEIVQEDLHRLHHHALIKAHAKEYVRESQVRLILQRVANRLLASLSKTEIGSKIARLLSSLRQQSPLPGGYAAGNLLNLLLLLEIDLTGYDFSHLPVWQADFRRAKLPGVNFSGADLTHTSFVDCFGFIFDAVYSPDGTWIATATDKGEVRVWQAADGRLVRSLAGHLGTVRSVAFSPNGELLASGGEDGTVRIWNLLGATVPAAGVNSPPQILRGHSGRVLCVAFHPDGKRVASASVDQSVRLWDLATGECTAILQGHAGWVWSLIFHADGATLASGGQDQTIRLWDVESASTRAIFRGHSGTVSNLAFDPQGDTLASGSFDRTVRLWDLQSGQTIQHFEASLDALWRIAFSPDGTLLATAGDDQVARIWELQSGSILHVLHGHKDVIFALAFSPDGKTLLTGAADQAIHLWDLPTVRIRQIIAGPNQTVPTIAYHPNGKFLISAYYNGIVRIWDLERQPIRQRLLEAQGVISTLAIGSDGSHLAIGGDDLELWKMDGEGRLERRHLLRLQRGRLFALAFSANGSLLASCGLDDAVFVWEVMSGQVQQKLPGYNVPIYALAFSPDGSLLATGSSDQQIHLWDPNQAILHHQWRPHTHAVWSLIFTPDGQTLVSAGGDGLIYLWDIRRAASSTAQPLLRATLQGHTDRIFSLAISADGKHLYSGSADRTIRVWDLQNHQLIQTLQGHTHWVWSISLSPDDKTLASAGPDETIRLWETQSGECLTTLVAPGPYEGMNIYDVQGITEAEKATLKVLGAVAHK